MRLIRRLLSIQQEIVDDAKLRANKEARKIIIQTIQRTAAEQAIENCDYSFQS